MQVLTLEKGQTTKLFWLTVAVMLAVMVFTGRQEDPGVVVAAIVLGIVSVFPLYCWLLGLSHGLPTWPVFSIVNGVTAALPMIQKANALADYTPAEIMVGSLTMIGFIILGTIVWLALTGRQPSVPQRVLMIRREHVELYLFIFIVAGLFFLINSLFWWFTLPGNTLSIVRGISMSLNTLGIFVLAYYAGRKMLSKRAEFWLILLASATGLAGAASLIMATAMVSVAMLVLGYALGSGKIPWKLTLSIFAVAAVLHPGKFAMREAYWGEDREALTFTGLPQYFGDWIGYGLEEVGLTKSDGRDTTKEETTSIFERGGNIHMLLLVQKKSPDEVPFLKGITYEPIPRLLTPRILDEGKGVSHAGNILLSVNYGVQTIEDTQNTSIGWGLVPEAYANFGYGGVATLAVLLALFYGLVGNLTAGVPMTSLRFVLGLMIMAAATSADTMGVFATTQFQGVLGVSFAAIFLMRRQENPLAGLRRAESGVRRAGDGKQGTGNRRRRAEGVSRNPESAEVGERRPEVRDQRSEIGERRSEIRGRRSEVGDQKSDLELTNLRPKTASGLPRRVAPWMTPRMRRQIAAQNAAIGDSSKERGSQS